MEDAGLIKPNEHSENSSNSRGYYAGYHQWKRWTNRFTFAEEEAEYFRGELHGIALAGKNVLDLGFGPGRFLAWVKAAGANVAGTEINPILLEEAQRAGVEVVPSDIEKVAQNYAGRFDLITAFDVFEHFTLEEITLRLRAIDTMLRPGGQLLLRFPNGQSPFGLSPQHGDVTHKIALSKDMVEHLCKDTHLHVQRYSASYRVRGPHGLKRIARKIRYMMRDLIGAFLNAVYAYDIPWDAVVVLVLQKKNDRLAR